MYILPEMYICAFVPVEIQQNKKLPFFNILAELHSDFDSDLDSHTLEKKVPLDSDYGFGFGA